MTVLLTPSSAASARLAGSRSPAASWPSVMAVRSWAAIWAASGTALSRLAASGSSTVPRRTSGS